MSDSSDDEVQNGEITLSCGAKYVGPVKDGMPSGTGKVITPIRLSGGEMYLGQLLNGTPAGEGCVKYLNNFSFTGLFPLYSGHADVGTITDPQNVPITGYYVGVPYLGLKHFTGFFINGQRNGHGILTSEEDATWEGNYSADRKNGIIIVAQYGYQIERVFVHGTCESEKSVGPAELQAAADRRAAAQRSIVDKKLKINYVTACNALTAQFQRQKAIEESEKAAKEGGDKVPKSTQMEKLAALKEKMQADKNALRSGAMEKQPDGVMVERESENVIRDQKVKQLQSENEQLHAQTIKLQATAQKATDDLAGSTRLVADLQDLLRTRGNEFASRLSEKQNEVERLLSAIAKSKVDSEMLQYENEQKVLQLSSDGQRYVQQLQQQIAQLSTPGSDERGTQQHELDVLRLQQARQEVEMMKVQVQQTNEMMRLKEEIGRQREEISNLRQAHQAELDRGSALQGNVCMKCGAQFLDAEEASCKRVKCPLCDVKAFKDQDQFLIHIESHKKRDNVASE